MDNQTYQIALSPDLDITSEEFTNAWNETPEARALAEARLIEAEEKQFDAALIAGILISVGTGVASNLLTDLITDVIQRLRNKKGVQSSQGTPSHKHTHIEQLKKADGTEMLIVDIDE
jgi:uncharacterized protein YjhX (UPF0386 family)